MLKSLHVVLALALLLAMIGDSSGQSKPEPPRQNSSGAQQRTNTEQPDTDQAPPSIIIKTPSPEQTQPKPTANEQKGPDNQSETWGLSDKIAVAASVFALLQFFALIATVCIMMSTAKRQLRAYLSIESAIIDGKHQLVPNFKSKITFKNCGQTPAYDGIMQMRIDACSSPPPLIFDGVFIFEMPPGHAFTTRPASDSNELGISNSTISDFDAGKIAIYISGQADFKDAFGNKRWFKFRFRYDKDCVTTGELHTDYIKSN